MVLLVVLLVAYSWQGKGGSGSAVATDFMPPLCSSSVSLGMQDSSPGTSTAPLQVRGLAAGVVLVLAEGAPLDASDFQLQFQP